MSKLLTLSVLALAIWSTIAVAEQGPAAKRVAVVTNFSDTDADAQNLVKSFTSALEKDKPNSRAVTYDYFWSDGNIEAAKRHAKTIVSMQPDVIFAATTPVVRALLQETRTIPIIFATVADPVGSGFVQNLAVPGGNVSGFINSEGSIAGKWVQYLKELVPGMSCVSMMYNPNTAPYFKYYVSPFEETSKSLNVEPSLSPVSSERDIESVITGLAPRKCGLVLMNDSFNFVHRRAISAISETHGIPVVAYNKATTRDEALVAYGPEEADAYKKAAGYVRKIIDGAQVGKLPVQLNTHFYLSVNVQKARRLGIEIPDSFLSRVDDEVE